VFPTVGKQGVVEGVGLVPKKHLWVGRNISLAKPKARKKIMFIKLILKYFK
jgi:hypothetical protein